MYCVYTYIVYTYICIDICICIVYEIYVCVKIHYMYI